MSKLTPRVNRLEQNLIMNGAAEVAQRGNSIAVPDNNAVFGPDRFAGVNVNTGVSFNISQDSLIVTSQLNRNILFQHATAGTLAAGTSTGVAYGMEGFDARAILSDAWSLIFWVRSSVASTRSVALANEGFTHSLVKQYTINAPNTWEMKVLTFPKLSDCPGTINLVEGLGLRLFFSVVQGTTFRTGTLNSWQAGDFRSGNGEDTTWLTGTSQTFHLSGIMAAPGDWSGLVSADYRYTRAGKTQAGEIAMLERYFEKTYQIDVVPGVNTITGTYAQYPIVANIQQGIGFGIRKRTTPQIVLYGQDGTINSIYDAQGGTPRAANGPFERSSRMFIATTDGAVTLGNIHRWHYTADAEFTLI